MQVVGDVERVYFRSDLFAKRRRLMDQWGAFLTGATRDNPRNQGRYNPPSHASIQPKQERRPPPAAVSSGIRLVFPRSAPRPAIGVRS